VGEFREFLISPRLRAVSDTSLKTFPPRAGGPAEARVKRGVPAAGR
jgi:hypothetical protein